ncbi:unnamed protein product [Cochlearia groenlandica]
MISFSVYVYVSSCSCLVVDLLFLDLPAGVGFSYSNTTSGLYTLVDTEQTLVEIQGTMECVQSTLTSFAFLQVVIPNGFSVRLTGSYFLPAIRNAIFLASSLFAGGSQISVMVVTCSGACNVRMFHVSLSNWIEINEQDSHLYNASQPITKAYGRVDVDGPRVTGYCLSAQDMLLILRLVVRKSLLILQLPGLASQSLKHAEELLSMALSIFLSYRCTVLAFVFLHISIYFVHMLILFSQNGGLVAASKAKPTYVESSERAWFNFKEAKECVQPIFAGTSFYCFGGFQARLIALRTFSSKSASHQQDSVIQQCCCLLFCNCFHASGSP